MALEEHTKRITDQFVISDADVNKLVKEFLTQMSKHQPLLSLTVRRHMPKELRHCVLVCSDPAPKVEFNSKL